MERKKEETEMKNDTKLYLKELVEKDITSIRESSKLSLGERAGLGIVYPWGNTIDKKNALIEARIYVLRELLEL